MLTIDSPVGPMRIEATDEGLKKISFGMVPFVGSSHHDKHSFEEEAALQLQEYFDGKRTEFSLPLVPEGTAFQKRVWKTLETIQEGETMTYGEIADRVGSSGGAQAVGQAVGANPIVIVIPCHRVLPSSGGIGGFSGGVEKKKWLLDRESVCV